MTAIRFATECAATNKRGPPCDPRFNAPQFLRLARGVADQFHPRCRSRRRCIHGDLPILRHHEATPMRTRLRQLQRSDLAGFEVGAHGGRIARVCNRASAQSNVDRFPALSSWLSPLWMRKYSEPLRGCLDRTTVEKSGIPKPFFVCASRSPALPGKTSPPRLLNSKIPADFSRREIVHLAVARNAGRAPHRRIPPDGMAAAFAQELTAVLTQMALKVETLHAGIISGSRTQSAASCWRARSRLVSTTR